MSVAENVIKMNIKNLDHFFEPLLSNIYHVQFSDPLININCNDDNNVLICKHVICDNDNDNQTDNEKSSCSESELFSSAFLGVWGEKR